MDTKTWPLIKTINLENDHLSKDGLLDLAGHFLTADDLVNGELEDIISMANPQQTRNFLYALLENCDNDYIAARLMGAEREDDSNAI